MAEQAEKIEQGLERVYERLDEMEKRLAALERREVAAASAPIESILGVTPKEKVRHAGSTSAVPVLGKAVLAIAGAYLLRAVAESGVAPRWIMLVAGIAYAGVWLVWAARSHGRSHFASEIYAMTAAAILTPLLWEGTVRFGVLGAGLAAMVLLGYVVLSLGLAWKEKLEVIPWVAVVAGVSAAMALLIATHELLPLTLGLLAIAFVAEAATWFGRREGLRVVTALGVLCALGVIGLVMTSKEGVPESYRPMSAGEISLLCVRTMFIFLFNLGLQRFVLNKE